MAESPTSSLVQSFETALSFCKTDKESDKNKASSSHKPQQTNCCSVSLTSMHKTKGYVFI